MQLRKGYLLVGAAVLVGAVAAIVHADQASQSRICRSIIPLLNPAGAELQMTNSAPTSGGQGLVLTYTAQLAGHPKRTRQLMCVFNRNRLGPDELLGLSADGRLIGPIRLALIKRFWLPSAESRAAADAFDAMPGR